jgi:hypothetical protein
MSLIFPKSVPNAPDHADQIKPPSNGPQLISQKSPNVAYFSKISAQRSRPRRPNQATLKGPTIDFAEITQRR